MMEFFLSKVWLFVCGIAVTAVLVMAFSGMDHAVTDDEVQQRATQLAAVLDSVSDSPDNVQMTISVADFLPDVDSVASIKNGYVSIESGTGKRYAPLHSATSFIDDNALADGNCTIVYGDLLIVHKDPSQDRIIIQVAKERTVSLTA